MTERIYSYAPVWNEDCRALILGTAPSVQSLIGGFFYAHPRNSFWRILADIFGEPLPASIDEKKALLLRNHIALWDVVESCEREGSLDSAIRAPIANDIGRLLAKCGGIQRICFNGATAHSLFRRHLPGAEDGRECIRLPSTSPAYTLPYESKLAAWRAALGGI